MNHKHLDAWKTSMHLVDLAYELSKSMPKYEDFILKQQFLKSAISIPSNIAEGCGRSSDKELIRFLDISLGSLAELDTQFEIGLRQNYFKNTKQFSDLVTNTRKLNIGLKKYIISKNVK
ncbi:four helix bundle protein [Flavobacteriaceae bacterium 14752]|uniref:four helix bundle protein n=1 Tax=Mesohalobacter salilacus TaxID=2491711 RepID=UPI000F640CE1|nr:four helix bundle protein [Flavobacteriaceae bacterium 14752]